MNLARALRIDGFMHPHELEWLADAASRHYTIAEIGCWQGRSTRALADNTPGTVFAIDHFCGSPEVSDKLIDLPPQWLYHTFMTNTLDCANVVPVRLPSRSAALLLAPLRFDMIFIDGGHDYSTFTADLDLWAPLLAPGGLLCGDDYSFFDIREALDAKLPAARRIPDTELWEVPV